MHRVAARLGVGVGIALSALGLAVLIVVVFGRPSVRISRSSTALAAIEVGGLGAHLSALHAAAGGTALAIGAHDGGIWPTRPLAQGKIVHVVASASPPPWLSWLLGGTVTANARLRTPEPVPAASVAVATTPRQLQVRFTRLVVEAAFAAAGRPTRTVHLRTAATTVTLVVPANQPFGTMEVTATAAPWERPSAPRRVSWFVAVPGKPAVLTTPAPGATASSGQSPLTLTFSAPVAEVLGSSRPTLSPPAAGTWSEPNPYTLRFTPSGLGFDPGVSETVHLDRAVSLMASTTDPATATSFQFEIPAGSVLRLQQLLAGLGYLPVTFTPAAGARQPATLAGDGATIDHPPAGTFQWRWANIPASLQAAWSPGQATAMTKGALMQFEAARNIYNDTVENQTVDQMATASVWTALLDASLAHQQDPYPYSYVDVSKALPETLTLWENGGTVLTSLVNTGIAVDPTADGTYPVYLRYTFQTMRGVNPDGTPYADPVHWISYFNGGDAVHGFVRASYGFPQSLGCVELPLPAAATVFPQLAIGDLVTVAN